MDTFEKVGYVCLGCVELSYLIALLIGMIAVFPMGLIGLVALLGIGALYLKVIRERRDNREDDHYQDTVDK